MLQEGEKFHFRKGGGINIIFWPKYRPLLHPVLQFTATRQSWYFNSLLTRYFNSLQTQYFNSLQTQYFNSMQPQYFSTRLPGTSIHSSPVLQLWIPGTSIHGLPVLQFTARQYFTSWLSGTSIHDSLVLQCTARWYFQYTARWYFNTRLARGSARYFYVSIHL